MTTDNFKAFLSALDMGNWTVDLQKGVYRDDPITNSKGDVVSYKRVAACPIPILPTAIMDNVDTGQEKVEISFYKHKRWKSIIVDREQIASNQKIVGLSNKGIEISSASARNMVEFFADIIARNQNVIPYKLSRASMGWYEKDFIPYTENITFDGEDQFRHIYRAVKSAGTLEEWIDYAAELRQNQQMRLMIDASFASPLIQLAGENPFVFHAWGTTSFGKTVGLMVAMSVWGYPAVGALTQTLNMTVNAMLKQASFLCNIPFAGDELQIIKNKYQGNFDNLIMSLTEGVDRGRMSYDKINETRSWKCAFLTTGEEPAIKSSSGGGAKNRVIEMECRDKLIKNGNLTASFVKTHYGTAAPVFIEAVRDMDIQAQYAAIFKEILDATDTTDKQAGAMALILLADRIVADIFFKKEIPLTVADVKQYLATDQQVSVAERAYSYICDAIAENINKFSADSTSGVWGLAEGDAVYMNKTRLCELLNSQGYDFDAVRREWAKKGYLKKSPDGKYRWTKSIKSKPFSCFKIMTESIDQETMFDEEDELPF